MENVLCARLKQIIKRKDKLSLNSFKNDELFVEIVKAAVDVGNIRGVTTKEQRQTIKETNVGLALQLLEMVSVDTKKIKPKEVLMAGEKLLPLLREIFFYYVNRMIRKYKIKTKGKPAEKNFKHWINQVLEPDLEVQNFQSDWMSGLALGALIDKVKPGLCSGWREFLPGDDKVIRITRLMEVAEESLNIYRIVEPEEMCGYKIDELSIMIYLTQFLELTNLITPRLNQRKYQSLSQYYEPLRATVPETPSSVTQSSVVSGSVISSSERVRSNNSQLSTSLPPSDAQETTMMSSGSGTNLASSSSVVSKSEDLRRIAFKPPKDETEFWKQIDDANVKYEPMFRSSVVRGKLDLKESLGSGSFGIVSYARFAHPQKGFIICAAKVLKDRATMKDVQDFLGEGWIAKSSNHPNILPLLEFCFHEGKPCLLFPYMKHGDLLNYLQKNKPNQTELIRFATDVTSGLKYLSEHGFVHRDLAARNCLVTDEITVILSDFGLSRDVWVDEYKPTAATLEKIPWKWTPPEIFRKNRGHDIKSDIWTLGVVFYEIFSHGEEPYKGESDVDQLLTKLSKGYRLPQPQMCSDRIYSLMRRCWDEQPEQRPSCDEVLRTLTSEPTYYDITSSI